MKENMESGSQDSNRGSPVVLIIGAVAMTLIIGAVYWASRYAPAPIKPSEIPLTMGGAEQDYVPHIEFEAQAQHVARATNFLNQEATFVFGTIKNNGPRPIRQIEVTLEFHDVFKQVVLRDKERLFDADAIPLESDHMRDFQITYEIMPAQWDQAYPTIRITGLNLQ
jgi:hypothetical protein